jgi:thiaminase
MAASRRKPQAKRVRKGEDFISIYCGSEIRKAVEQAIEMTDSASKSHYVLNLIKNDLRRLGLLAPSEVKAA